MLVLALHCLPHLWQGSLERLCLPFPSSHQLHPMHLPTLSLQVSATAEKGSNALAIGSSEADAKKGGKAVALTDVSFCAYLLVSSSDFAQRTSHCHALPGEGACFASSVCSSSTRPEAITWLWPERRQALAKCRWFTSPNRCLPPH